MHHLLRVSGLLSALFCAALSAQQAAVLPVRVPPPLAFALVPPPPFAFDSRVAVSALDVQRSNEGWGSLGMNLYYWRPGDHVAPIASPYASDFFAVMPFDLDVRQASVQWPANAAALGDGATRAAFEERAAALRALAATAPAYDLTSGYAPSNEPTSNWGVSVSTSNYDPWGWYGYDRYRSDCAFGFGYQTWACR